jgi:dGTPase
MSGELSERAQSWAATMDGYASGAFRRAHADSAAKIGPVELCDRVAREEREDAELAPGATRARGAGNRARMEEPDPARTCFERDRDRILHGTTAFRRLAGKTQVFIFPEDHQRTRLTHALEVAQVATGIAAALRLNVALTEAIALGHDCGHGPFGHASEDAFEEYIPGGFDHAVWGADVVLEPVNLCAETLDGIRNHSWSRPAPGTPEGEVVSWADRIAYVCHDFEDAVRAGIVTPAMLPASVRELCGSRRSRQLHAFISSVVETALASGEIGMATAMADALAEFRSFNYERIYMRPASVAQGDAVVRVLHALVEHYAGSGQSLREAVTYVAGMTDRFAFTQSVTHLGLDPGSLPAGLDLAIQR